MSARSLIKSGPPTIEPGSQITQWTTPRATGISDHETPASNGTLLTCDPLAHEREQRRPSGLACFHADAGAAGSGGAHQLRRSRQPRSRRATAQDSMGPHRIAARYSLLRVLLDLYRAAVRHGHLC